MRIFELLEAKGLMKMLDDVANRDTISVFVTLGMDYLLIDQLRFLGTV